MALSFFCALILVSVFVQAVYARGGGGGGGGFGSGGGRGGFGFGGRGPWFASFGRPQISGDMRGGQIWGPRIPNNNAARPGQPGSAPPYSFVGPGRGPQINFANTGYNMFLQSQPYAMDGRFDQNQQIVLRRTRKRRPTTTTEPSVDEESATEIPDSNNTVVSLPQPNDVTAALRDIVGALQPTNVVQSTTPPCDSVVSVSQAGYNALLKLNMLGTGQCIIIV